MFRKNLTILGCALALSLTFAGTQAADAATVHFRFTGGSWSHEVHRGWHRYWGGPEVGFYYAAAPVYIVDGYADADYYSGPDFWYSNPSFGLRVSLGGGGYRYGGERYYDDRLRGHIDEVRSSFDRDRGYRVDEHIDRVERDSHAGGRYIYGDRDRVSVGGRDLHAGGRSSGSESHGEILHRDGGEGHGFSGGSRGEVSHRDGGEGRGFSGGGHGDEHDRR